MKYEWRKMKRDARKKCSLFCLYFIRALVSQMRQLLNFKLETLNIYALEIPRLHGRLNYYKNQGWRKV